MKIKPVSFEESDHVAMECDGCEGGCMFCEGGLFACSVCNSFEGATTTYCPKVAMTSDQSDKVYAGELDFRDGEWKRGLTSQHAPGWYDSEEGLRYQKQLRKERVL